MGEQSDLGGKKTWTLGGIERLPRVKQGGGAATGAAQANTASATPPTTPPTARKPSQATILVRIGSRAELFHTCDQRAFVSFDVDGHCETWPVSHSAFRTFLSREFFNSRGTVPHTQAITSALSVLQGKAQYAGSEQSVYVRLAEREGKIYLDLANSDWEVVEVTPEGWRILSMGKSPVKFRRPPGLMPLPRPVSGGTLEALRPFVNVPDGADWILVVAWLLASLRPKGPYAVLVIFGPHGSAKSATTKVLRGLIDPNTAPLKRIT